MDQQALRLLLGARLLRLGEALRTAPQSVGRLASKGGPEASPHALNTELVKAASEKLGIAVRDLPGGFLELQRGDQTHRSHGSDFDFEGLLPWMLCGDKSATSTVLSARGLPVAPFDSFTAACYGGALEFFRECRKPVVTKPTRGTSSGTGVSLDIRTEGGFRSGFMRALPSAGEVTVEPQIDGDNLRVTVLGGEVLGAVRRIPANVVGDGSNSVRELVSAKNEGWRVRGPENRLLQPILIDGEVNRLLRRRGMDLDTVPGKMQLVTLRQPCNADLGGEIEAWEPRLHPEYIRLSLAAATALGATLCGVDLIAPDATAGGQPGEAIINEVNTTPALYISAGMASGAPSTYPAERVLRLLFDTH